MIILDTDPDHIPTVETWDIGQMELLALALDALSIRIRLDDTEDNEQFGIDF